MQTLYVGQENRKLNGSRRITLLCLLVVSSALGCCVPYPIYKATQPSARMTVVDAQGAPLEGAEVMLLAHAHPYGFEKGRSTKTTASDGTAQFDSEHDLRVEVFALHGAEIYYWDWCVSKPGYQTYFTKLDDADPVVHLQPGTAMKCPDSLTMNAGLKPAAPANK